MAMTKEDIIRMAMESGITKVMDESSYRWLLEGREPINEVFIKFANLVAAAEREACAVICENDEDYSNGDVNYHSTLIRARGK